MRDIKLRFFDTSKAIMFTSDDVNSYEVWDYVQDKRFKNMQFTGLQDKNGVDIFKDDIIVIVYRGCSIVTNYAPKQVKWDSQKCGFNISKGIECEVIGNIHENPELL